MQSEKISKDEAEERPGERDSFLHTLCAMLAMAVLCVAGVAIKILVWG